MELCNDDGDGDNDEDEDGDEEQDVFAAGAELQVGSRAGRDDPNRVHSSRGRAITNSALSDRLHD